MNGLLYMFSFKESASKSCKTFAKTWKENSQRSEASHVVFLKGAPLHQHLSAKHYFVRQHDHEQYFKILFVISEKF